MSSNSVFPGAPQRIDTILRERARVLAQPQKELGSASHRTELLVVRVGKALYAMPLVELGGVVPIGELTPLPGAPPFIAGVGNLQGRVLSVVHLAAVLGEAREPPRAAVLVESGADAFAIGVSSYEGVVPDATGRLVPLPGGASSAATKYVEGVIASTGVGVLRLSRIIEDLLHEFGHDERK
ncbi:MAG TPA: chemotaxis protein CheW [Polyangiaceae bacterium]